MRNRVLTILITMTMALAGAAVGAAPAGAAGDNAIGYSSTPKKADGSLDFTGWTSLGEKGRNVQLADLKYARNGIDYEVKVNTTASNRVFSSLASGLLVANVIVNNTSHESWTYSFRGGNARTSELWYQDATTGGEPTGLLVESATYYQITTDKGVAVAVVGQAKVGGAAAPNLTYSEVLDVSDEGELIHNVTFTNTGSAAMPGISLSARLDTALSGESTACPTGAEGDCVAIISNGTNSVYIDNGTFRLYLDMLQGDLMSAGEWGWEHFYIGNSIKVNDFAVGQTVLSGVDSAVGYGLAATDLAPNQSVNLAFRERIFAPSEIRTVTVKYVDDDAGGAVVTPVDGTTTSFTGATGTAVGFTEADAKKGIPPKYELKSIDNVDTYGATDSTITVHLVHAKTVEELTTTRTIKYEVPAGVTAPVDVVQTQKWTKSTDQVTGEVSYAAADGYPAKDSPVITGYVATPATVAATGPVAKTTTVPENTTVKVTYAKGEPGVVRTVTVKYVDDNANGAAVTPVAGTTTTFTGAPGTAVGFTEAAAKAGVPAKYEYVSVDNVTTFGDADATITVHTRHVKTVEVVTTTRTITYDVPAGMTAPVDVVQTQNWAKSTDEVTGEVTYESVEGYGAVKSPVITGCVATPETVPATGAVVRTTTVPANSTVKVTYAKGEATPAGGATTTGPAVKVESGGAVSAPAGSVVLAVLLVLGGLTALSANLKKRGGESHLAGALGPGTASNQPAEGP